MAGTPAPNAFLDFEIVGDRQGVQRMLSHLDSALSPVGLASFLHGAVQPWLLERAKNRFASEGDDAVGKWAPLQASTVEIRESQGFEGPHPINVRTHELEQYITQADVDITSAPGVSTLKFPGGSGAGKSVVEKMRTAQKGRSSPSTVPRPVLGMNERDLGAVMTELAFHVKEWKSNV